MHDEFDDLHPKAHDEETWIVSYADMVTLLFGFFVILFSFSTMDDRKLSAFGKDVAKSLGSKVKEKTAGDMGVLSQEKQLQALQLLIAMLNLGETVDEGIKNLESKISAAKDANAAKDMVLDGLAEANSRNKTHDIMLSKPMGKDGIVEIVLPSNALFDPGTNRLSAQAIRDLKEVAVVLRKTNDLAGIEVVGHTDAQPPAATAEFHDNWALSSARAGAVAQVLIKNGVDRSHLLTRGMADLQPLFPEQTPEGKSLPENRAKNRRVHIVLRRLVGAHGP